MTDLSAPVRLTQYTSHQPITANTLINLRYVVGLMLIGKCVISDVKVVFWSHRPLNSLFALTTPKYV